MKAVKNYLNGMYREKFALFSSILLLAACGSAPQSMPPAPQAGAMTGTINPLSCQSQRGTLITSPSGQQLCRIVIDSAAISMSYTGTFFPIITPSLPAGRNPYTPGITVRRNDKVLFSGQSLWGGTNISTTSYLGGFFNFSTVTTDCALITGAGTRRSNGAPAPLNEGVAPGLMASDGFQTYLLGDNLSVIIQNDGVLRLGFNTPLTYASMNCGQLVIHRLSIERCINSLGASVSCS